MDIALCIEKLVPTAQYFGVPGSTEKEYNSLNWNDKRAKPLWKEIESAWILVQKDLENGVILTQLESTDNKMPRALEDIIDILVKKGTKVSDVPEAVIKVYKLKKDLRGKILK